MSSAFRLARGEHNVVISCEMKLNLDYLVESLWEHLDLIRWILVVWFKLKDSQKHIF